MVVSGKAQTQGICLTKILFLYTTTTHVPKHTHTQPHTYSNTHTQPTYSNTHTRTHQIERALGRTYATSTSTPLDDPLVFTTRISCLVLQIEPGQAGRCRL